MRGFARDAAFRRLARGSGLMLTLNFGGAAFALVAAALAGRAIGGARFGIYTFCMAWAAGLVTLCEAGLDGALEREVARDPGESASLGRTGLAAKLPLVALACGAVALGASRLAGADAVAGLRLAAFQAAGLALLGVFAAVFRGNGAYGPAVAAGLAGGLIQALATAVVVMAGGTEIELLGLAAAIAWVQCLGLGLLFLARYGRRIGPAKLQPARLYRLAAPFLAGVAVRVAQGRIAPLMLGYFVQPLQVGFFGAASRVADTIRHAPNGLLQGTYSLFASGGSDRRRAVGFYWVAMFGIAVVGGAGIFVAGPAFVLAVFGTGFAGAADVTRALGLAFGPAVIADAAITYLYAAGDEAIAVRWNTLALVIQAGLTLVAVEQLGAAGAALALGAGRAVTCVPLVIRALASARRRFWEPAESGLA